MTSQFAIGIIICIVVLVAYLMIAETIKRNGWFSKYVTVGTADLIWLKTSNVGFIDSLTKPAGLFRVGATVGLVLTYIMMAGGALLTLLALVATIAVPHVPDKTNSVNNILLIPGVSDFVPLTVEVLLSIIILITLHELAHGILARIHGIDIKAAGAMFFVVPLGGFVDIDEDQIKALPLMGRLQIYAAGLTANILTLAIPFFATIFLISLSTGVSMIKNTPAETLAFFGKSFGSLLALPIINGIMPVPETLWITQNTVTWMPTHIEPFFGYWFLLHMMFWMFWVSFALIFTNALPLKVTDGGQIFENTVQYLLEKVNLGQYAMKVSNGVTVALLIAVCGIFFIPYIFQLVK